MMNFSIKLTTAVCLALLLSACGVYIENVKQTPNSNLAIIKENFEYTKDRNTPFCNETFTYRALAGTYYPEFEDNNGVYYRGKYDSIQFEPLKVSCMKEIPKISHFNWAGIYIPNNESLPAKMYVYSGKKPPGYQEVLPDDGQPKSNTSSVVINSSGKTYNPYENGFVPALILAIERDSIQIPKSQAEDSSLRSAITIMKRPASVQRNN